MGALTRNLLRFVSPRKRLSALNVLLLFVLIALIGYIGVKEWLYTLETLPPGEGVTWPPVKLHKRPDPGIRRSGPGEMGAPVFLDGKEATLGSDDMKKWFMNVHASDKISLDRSVPDVRMAECKSIAYDLRSLPRATVVIIFTDEAWTPLLRTVHSVINRSPPELLEEVLLVDDASQREELKDELDTYIQRFGGKVQIVRKTERQGLIRAKLVGAMQSKSDVVVFLDSHCEASDGWLEPMLARIKEKRSAIWRARVGFRRRFLVEARKSKTDAIPSPTMAGGLLAADRKYFLEVGGYDPGMDIWGGENLEISFRVWMCGGIGGIVPCSHVGHIFRAGHPYNMTAPDGNKDVHGTNSKRLAEVWMDDYKRLYYLHRSDLKDKDVGDLGERKALRRKLKCKSFKWYLDNVIPEKFVPNENVLGYGALRNPESQLCLDTLQKDESGTIPLSLFQCQGGGSSAQMFSWTRDGVVRREISCAVVGPNNKVQMGTCAEESDANRQQQKWEFTKDGLVKNLGAGLCLDTAGTNNGDQLALADCEPSKGTQKWEFAYANRK
uniref:Polypeptide N-acetylgalactosaminyltransferase n=1 Tax=Globodera rostochiensis TaxID=31243 RepID=A0A914I716_GLORO